jgi:hypothetical protein
MTLKLRLVGCAMVMLLMAVVSRADYMNITIDGDFSDWVSVSTIATDPADNPGSIDFLTYRLPTTKIFFLFGTPSPNSSIRKAARERSWPLTRTTTLPPGLIFTGWVLWALKRDAK